MISTPACRVTASVSSRFTRLHEILSVQASSTLHLDQRFFHIAEVVVRGGRNEVRLIEIRIEDQGAPARRQRVAPIELTLPRHRRAREVCFG